MEGRTRVSLTVGARTVDLVADDGVPVHELLRRAGLDALEPGAVLVDSTGRHLDPWSADLAGLPDGAVLHVGRTRRPAATSRRGRVRADASAARPPEAWSVAAVTAGLVVLATVLLDHLGPRTLSGGATAVVLAALLAVVAAVSAMPRRASVPLSLAAVTTAAAAGALTVDPARPGADGLVVVVALATAVGVGAVRWARLRRVQAAAPDDVLVTFLAAALLACGVPFLVGLPGTVAAALLLGAVPLVLRALPALVLDVPDDQLLDTDLVARTVSRVRAERTRPLGRVNTRLLRREVTAAETRRDVLVVLLAVLAPVSAAVLLLTGPGAAPAAIAAPVAVGLVAVVLALQPRVARGAMPRRAPRVGAVMTAGTLLLVLPGALRAAAVLIGVGVALSLVAALVARGRRSLGLSRAGDALEGLAAVLALPAALIGAGVVELLRQVTS